jgi:uncharacterized protein DUF3105
LSSLHRCAAPRVWGIDGEGASYDGRALPKKSQTPPPPRRPVQVPKVRTAPRDPRRNRTILLTVGGSALVLLAVVLGFVLLAGGGSAATSAAEKLRDAGCEVRTVPAAANFRLKGKRLPFRHLPSGTLPPGFRYSTNPPTSGIHTNETVIYGIYDEPVPTVSTVHNLEHGAIVIRYGPDVPEQELQPLRELYADDPNGLVVAPMPGLGATIALTAWTFDQGRSNDRSYDGEGHLARCTQFDEDAFKAFIDAYRAKGPERFEVSDMLPGRG